MGFRGRRLDAGGWTPGAGPGGASRFGRRGGRTDGVAEEAAWAVRRADGRVGRSGGTAERKDGRDGRAGLEKLGKIPPRPGLGLSRVRSVILPRSAKGPLPQGPPAGVPPRESRTPSRSAPTGSRPVKGPFGQPPGQPKGRSVKVPPRPELLLGRVASPLHVRVPTAPSPLSSPSFPPPLLYPSGSSTPPTPRPSILRSGAAEPQGPRFDRRGWNRPSQGVEQDFGCGARELPPRRGLRCRGLRVAGRSRRRADRHPEEREGQTSRKKKREKSRKGFSSRRGRKRRSGEAAEPRREDRWSNAAVQR